MARVRVIRRSAWFAVLAVVLVAAPVAGATTETAHSGNVTATFSYRGGFQSGGFSHLHLSIARSGHTVYDRAVSSPKWCFRSCVPGMAENSSVHVVDLESTGDPDVVLDLYTGGAHCCYIEQVFTFDASARTYVKTERNFGNIAGVLEALGHNGRFEFVSADSRFDNAFTISAASGLPIQILTFRGGKFDDVTRQYPDEITKDADKWWRLYEQNVSDGRGFIAAWAADEYLLGDESKADNRLDEELHKGHLKGFSGYPSSRQFVADLKKFLRDHGYATEKPCSDAPITTDKSLDIEGCFVPGDHGTYTSSGDVKVNGLWLLPAGDATITIQPSLHVLHATGSGVVKLGGVVPVWDWAPGDELVLPLTGQVKLVNNASAKVYGFPVQGSLQAGFGDGDLTVTGNVSLRVLGNDVTASLELHLDNQGISSANVVAKGAGEDPKFHELASCSLNRPPPLGFDCASVTNAKGNTYSGLVPKEPAIAHIGPLPIEDVSFDYDRDKHEWSGEGELAIGDLLPGASTFGKLLPTLGLGATIGTSPFQFDGASASDSDLNLTLGPAVLKKIQFSLKLHPKFALSGDADLAATAGSIEIDGGFDYELGKSSGFLLKLHGKVSLETVSIDGFVAYDGRDGAQKVTLGGSFDRSFGPASANLGLSGGVGGGHFELDGDGSVSAFGLSADGHGVLSDAGVGACAHVSALFFSGDIGFTHTWNGRTDFNGCDFGGLHTLGLGGAIDAGAGRTFTVSRGMAREEIAVTGAAGPPGVFITGPGGEQVGTPPVADRAVLQPGGLAVAVSSTNTTYLILYKPAAGRWTIRRQSGGVAPIRYEIAQPIRALHLRAKVSGRGRHRTLRWRFAAQRGVSVRFIQRGGTERTVITTSRDHGSVAFSAAPGPRGRRTVMALVSVDGVPHQLLSVASFRASAPYRPRVRRARYRLRRGVLRVSWARVRRASYYEVGIRLRGGRNLVYRLAGRSSGARFRLGRHARIKRVTVIVAVRGLAGRAVTARR